MQPQLAYIRAPKFMMGGAAQDNLATRNKPVPERISGRSHGRSPQFDKVKPPEAYVTCCSARARWQRSHKLAVWVDTGSRSERRFSSISRGQGHHAV